MLQFCTPMIDKFISKKVILSVLLVNLLCVGKAQTSVVFSGRDNVGGYIQLHHVVVEDITQQWTDTLYYPDTVLILQGVGIPGHTSADKFSLSQNTPNPFSGVTDFSLTLPRAEHVVIDVQDLAGRKITGLKQWLDAGRHTFRVWLSTPQQYVLTVRTSHDAASIKMLNSGTAGGNHITYVEGRELLKLNLYSDHPHASGDMMRVTGFCQLYNGDFSASEVVEQPIDVSCSLNLVFTNSVTVINDGHYVCTDTIFIPDGMACNGNCICDIPLSISGYEGGRLIQSVNDIQYVRLKIEHSFIGDLWIQLSCPSGKTATLLKKYNSGSSPCSNTIPSSDWGWDYQGSSKAFFGLYYKPDGSDKCDPVTNPMGVCWNYCWSDDTTHGQTYACDLGHICQSCNRITANNPNGESTMYYVDSSNVANRSNFYHPDKPFSNLVGCPLNGTWHIKIIDGFSQDNGYVEEVELVLVEDTLVTPIDAPTVMTGSCLSVDHTEALCEGFVVLDGNSPITVRGICWSTSPSPTLSDSHTSETPGMGSFTSQLTNLVPGETYYYKAYATNAMGTGYGETAQLTATPNTVPSVTTLTVSNNTGYTVTCGGVVTDDGGAPVLERGICWSTSYNPTISDNYCVDSAGVDTFSCQASGLTPGTVYFIRAYATNAVGTGYGNSVYVSTANFLNLQMMSLADTTNVSVTATAKVVGSNTSNSGKGFCWSTSPNPTMDDDYIMNDSPIGGWNGTNFTSTIEGLDPGTTYYVRSFATNVVGTAYSSNQLVFNTLAQPKVETDSVQILANSLVQTGGNILHNGFLPITAAGVCWATSPNPTVSDSHFPVSDTIGNFQVTLSGLSADSIYYLRAYAINSAGTTYGQEFMFRARLIYGQSCPNDPSVTDYDGNVYSTVQLGTQCWMAENLRTTHFANGTTIPLGTQEDNSNYFRYYPNNDSSLVDQYGYMYNWKAAVHGSGVSSTASVGVQGVCPDGWHLPSKAEWFTLRIYVGNQSQYRCADYTSSIAKSLASTTGWQYYSDTCAVGYFPITNNETGFNAYPAGGEYMSFGQEAAFWSASEYVNTGYGGYSYLYVLAYWSEELYEYDLNQWFQWHSVRCVKN